MKFVKENISDILKPRDESEIIQALHKSSVTEVINRYGDNKIVWQSLAKRGMTSEEIFRNAYSAKKGTGVDYAIEQGATGKYLSDEELISGFLEIDKSELLYDFIIKKIPPNELFKKIDLEAYGTFRDETLPNLIKLIDKTLDDISNEDLFNILQKGNENGPKPKLIDVIAKKIKPNVMFDHLVNNRDWGGREFSHPAKSYLLQTYPNSFDKEFIIKYGIKHKIKNLVFDNFDSLKDMYNSEQILKLMLKLDDSYYINRALKDANLKKIKPNIDLYIHLRDKNNTESIKTLINSGNNTPALFQSLRKTFRYNRKLLQMIEAASQGVLSPNARQGADIKEAIRKRDVELVKQYLEHPNISNNTLKGSFFVAAEYGNKKIIRMFLDDDRIEIEEIYVPDLLARAGTTVNTETLQELINDSRIKNYKTF